MELYVQYNIIDSLHSTISLLIISAVLQEPCQFSVEGNRQKLKNKSVVMLETWLPASSDLPCGRLREEPAAVICLLYGLRPRR